MLVLVQTHLFINPVFDLGPLLNLDDAWPVRWVHQSNLIISVNLVELADFDQIVNDLTAVGPPEHLLTSSALSLLDVFIPTLDGTLVCLVDPLLTNGPNIDILVENVQLAYGIIVVEASALAILSLN